MPTRCAWVPLSDPLYIAYHDLEWGVPLHEDRKIFELLTLEAAQAGLSWKTVLHKRENFRAAFDNFDPEKVARYGDKKLAELLADPGIIRNRLKVSAAINNAARFLEVQKEFGSFDSYIWRFVGGRPRINARKTIKEVPATSPESDALSLDLKKRGFKFVGPTVIYAHMQASGMVNDHTLDCFRYRELAG
ncbi:MAG: DNA-3-methyladenine glycosylase [Candidatus Glassbacteria bacterium RIFCSPLOWO2_12_FULL_58_11]|uniref:DNA-3-methyladenine glycosylase I n=1 Tax=Candidatus Glassbacteria bacterium RIFCSPLOWO2_12_FULL_58_11 TaxID=1817867 RepID=A0A1F5Z116_9BACT|nr:MAG: DNA-3-methyladenine glycosylase [Candidatus Glassbacteria bacterium RIFCSPLOWO2_12_FULL_58_11]